LELVKETRDALETYKNSGQRRFAAWIWLLRRFMTLKTQIISPDIRKSYHRGDHEERRAGV